MSEKKLMLCDKLTLYHSKSLNLPIYMASEVDAAIAELKKKLMPCLNGDCILTCEVVEKYGKENAELKKKLEDVQASHYAEMVDAGMENRRLKLALWLARAERARAMSVYWYVKKTEITNWNIFETKWSNIEQLCRAKAKEYKR